MAPLLVPILGGTIVAATPLIYAAMGELVAERSGVINLGVEGMMLIGAVTAFAVAFAGYPPLLAAMPPPAPARSPRWRSRFWRSAWRPTNMPPAWR